MICHRIDVQYTLSFWLSLHYPCISQLFSCANFFQALGCWPVISLCPLTPQYFSILYLPQTHTNSSQFPESPWFSLNLDFQQSIENNPREKGVVNRKLLHWMVLRVEFWRQGQEVITELKTKRTNIEAWKRCLNDETQSSKVSCHA